MSSRKEVIRIDAGLSNRLAKQPRMRAAIKSDKPLVRRWPVVAGALLAGCVALALGVLGVREASKDCPELGARTREPEALVAQPVAPAVSCEPVSPTAVAAHAPDSPPVAPVSVGVAAPERAQGEIGKPAARGARVAGRDNGNARRPMSNVQVAEKETHGSLFARLDANRDGYVSSAEYAALVRNKQKHRGQILALDKDRDGRITETELRGIGLSQLLKWLDVQQ